MRRLGIDGALVSEQVGQTESGINMAAILGMGAMIMFCGYMIFRAYRR
jgi:hypothetical protein